AYNPPPLGRALPSGDSAGVTAPPSADVTAHVLEMLALEGRATEAPARSAREWLLRAQETDGSWFGRWGANHVYGTGAAVPALVRAGMERDHPAIRRAVRCLESRQNEDGGFGEDLRSYEDASWRGRGASTASQTAWALLALLAADGRSPAARRGVEWLVRPQRPHRGWGGSPVTRTRLPRGFFIRYPLHPPHLP